MTRNTNSLLMIDKATQVLKKWWGSDPLSDVIVLGSGLGDLVHQLDKSKNISYSEIPGFPKLSVVGHGGQLFKGLLGRKTVMLLSGRAHFYENGDANSMHIPIATIAALGCKQIYLTNAAGGIADPLIPGSVMVLNDYVSLFVGQSPLFGFTGNKRFVDVREAFDTDMRNHLLHSSRTLGIDLHQGVYAWVCGPQFETPSEVRILQQLGCDAVGMSTVPETILARYYGIRVAALSNITNKACGLSNETLSHEHTVSKARTGAEKISALLTHAFTNQVD